MSAPACYDSHAHFDVFATEGVADEVLRRAREAGVLRVTAIGGSPEANALAARLAARHPAQVVATAGFDRDLAGQDLPWEELEQLAASGAVRGIGETGLDYHYARDTAPAQRALFQRQLELSARTGLPVVVHSRDAEADTLAALRDHRAAWRGHPDGPGVVHCFTGDPAFAAEVAGLGYAIGFSGILTFKKPGALPDVARACPESRILIETDAPYLAPVPHRGSRNEPARVVHVAEALDRILGWTPGRAAAISWTNASHLFGWKDISA